MVLDREGRIVLFNRACERVTGYTSAEVLGRRFHEFLLLPEERDAVEGVFESLRAGQFPNEHENCWVTRDGGRRIISWSNTALTDDAGTVRYVIGTGIDITDHTRAENSLRVALEESRRRSREMIGLVDAARAVLNHRRFEDAARAIFDLARDLTGARAGYVALMSADGTDNEVLFLEPGGLPCTVDPSLPMPIRGLRAEAYRTGTTALENDFWNSAWVRFMPEGHAPLDNVLFAPLVVEGRAVGLMGLANKPEPFSDADVRIAEAFGEITAVALQNSRIFELLTMSEERFRSVADSATDAIMCVDSEGSIVYWNEAATEMFGFARDDALGRPITSIMPEHLAERHPEGMARAFRTGQSELAGRTLEVVGRRADGTELPLEVSLASWRTTEGMFFTGIARDITERKRAETVLTRAYEAEHRVADVLRESLLPAVPHIDGLEIGVVYESAYVAEQIGGDFYDVFPLDARHAALLIGDVAGKGVRAASLTEAVRSSVRALAHVDASPGFILEAVNRALLERMPPDQFASAALIVMDTESGAARIASAGHPAPLRRGPACGVIDLPIGPPLGVVETSYNEHHLRLADGDLIVLYTDGLTDARRGSDFFGESGIVRTICSDEGGSPQSFADRLLREARAFAHGELNDDIAIVAARLSRSR